ncbi:FecR domain-containing protein [Hydrogenimonas thermophila]|uniref:FecR family protein n=1 Tax=Hydrogenimonas thermophila TaxID=223786 RepID=A0A1I5P1U3_9BACT|nr:FecR domain-containing protein [Hydrogenimonas thermophila]WOE69578.1 FecR domain-containing protein [Hydrogenimonas thermophila]WOE72092.1 FecR domain-containing protein [Hydrogenimonas thermophila]SFP28078.1 FecR family protein [Hydrogenimonas thermophila]
MKKLLIAFIIFMISAYSLVAKVGVVAAVKGEAYIQRSGKKIIANTGSSIEDKDIVITKENSKVQLIFNDKTVVTIGRNSKFSIKEYLFEDSKKSKVSFGMTKGLFRTITGKIGKIAPKKFKLKTKNATIGIRGTEIIIEASPIKGDKIACTQGAISVMSNFNGKSVYVEAGKITEVKPNSSPTPPRDFVAGDIDEFSKKKAKEDKKNKEIKKTSTEKEQKDETFKTEQSNETTSSNQDVSNDEKLVADTENKTTDNQNLDIAIEQHSNQISDAVIVTDTDIVRIAENIDTIVEITEDTVNTQNSNDIINTVNNEIETVSENIPNPTDSETAGTDAEAGSISSPPNTEVYDPSQSTTVEVDIPNPSNGETTVDIDTIEDSGLEETLYSDDYMSFGYWMDNENNPVDTWVNGTVSPAEAVEGYITDHITASYSGDVAAITNGKIATGTFDMSIDFGAQTLSGVMQFQAADEPTWKFEITDGLVTPYYFESNSIASSSDSDVEGISGNINGGFYGPNVESIGGSFQLDSISNGSAIGVFGGTKQ